MARNVAMSPAFRKQNVRGYRLAVLTDKPLLYWPLNEATGTTANDFTGKGKNGIHGTAVTITNADAVMLDPVVKFGASATLAATTVVPSVIAAPPALSIEFWARKTNDLTLNSVVYLCGDGSGNRLAQMHLAWTDGNLYWDCGQGVGTGSYDRISKVRDFTVTDWHHYVFTKNPSSGVMNIYVDGALWHTGSGLTRPIGTQTPGTAYQIMGNGYALDTPFDGSVAHFAMYDSELSAARVAAHYAEATRRTVTGTLVLYFDIRPDINSGNAGDVSIQNVYVNGTSIGLFTSGSANAAGPAVWATRSYDVTSLVTAGSVLSLSTAYSSGADTGYFRNVYVQDSNGQKYYGGYPNGTAYPLALSLTGGASESLWSQGAGAPSQYSVLANTYVTPTETDNRGHYYIPTRTLSVPL